MSYDLRCETLHFIWRQIRFVFVDFRLGNAGTKCAGGLVARVTQNAGDFEVMAGKSCAK
jgi:hypothetical protein